ncbi:hypothetical protein FRB99_000406 [Tulasnella sp. 403]|nr:hypothetical protein FRB99_000406 [Tulasnella sp. 403]
MLPPPSATDHHVPRTLVLCFDGTANALSNENTNVVRLFAALEKHRRERQLCYYQPGIGTYVAPTVLWANTFQAVSKVLDQAFAWYLDGHIMGGYRFLMENYKEGDRICLFGFSRGAYTARCLAGMLHKVGLLPKSNEEQIEFAWEHYRDVSDNGRDLAAVFKKAFSTSVDIEFMGVWDTVSSVGIFSRHLSFTSSNKIVKTFRHALALDERRVKFKPNPWHRPAPNRQAARFDPDRGTPINDSGGIQPIRAIQDMIHKISEHITLPTTRSTEESVAYDMELDWELRPDTDSKEVWFAGCHADVGGGSVPDDSTYKLANPSLGWMINEIVAANTGIIFKKNAFQDIAGFEIITMPVPRPAILDKPPPEAVSEIASISAHEVSTIGLTVNTGAQPLTLSPLPHSSSNTSLGYFERPVKFPQPHILEQHLPSPESRTPTPSASSTSSTSGESSPTRPPIQPQPSNIPGDPILHIRASDDGSDAAAPLHDQLKLQPLWWLLEYIPLWQYKQDAEGHWHKCFYQNKGRSREIPTPNPLFHSSVKRRQEMSEGKYQPRAVYDGTPEYVN